MASAEPPRTAPLGTGMGTGMGMVCSPHTSAGPHPAQGAGPAALQLLVSSIDRAVSVPPAPAAMLTSGLTQPSGVQLGSPGMKVPETFPHHC